MTQSPCVWNSKIPNVYVSIPSQQLQSESVQISPYQQSGLENFCEGMSLEKNFCEWSIAQHADSYRCIQQIVAAWSRFQKIEQYLIYGKADISATFTWEVVPYKMCDTKLKQVQQKINTAFRIAFGGVTPSKEDKDKQIYKLFTSLSYAPATSWLPASYIDCKDNDRFCNESVVSQQAVMVGKTVHVFLSSTYNSFDKEQLHFLITPKYHRITFSDVTYEEYSESITIAKKLVTHFTSTKDTIKNIYLFHKTGIDAGQTIAHWHMNIVFSTIDAIEDIVEKTMHLTSILFGTSPVKEDKLEKKRLLLKEVLTFL